MLMLLLGKVIHFLTYVNKIITIWKYSIKVKLCYEEKHLHEPIFKKSIWDESHFTVYVKKNLPHLFYEGTIAYEMMEIQDMKDLDAILVPISGGGMTAGIAIAAKGINPDIKGIKS